MLASTEAMAIPRSLAKHLSQKELGVAAFCQEVAVSTVRAENVVIQPQSRDCPDSTGFFAYVQV